MMNQNVALPSSQAASEPKSHKVAIFGGGLAGLAAAQALSAQGLQVELHEARTRLGGRASSFVDQTTGEVIDNCQHVAMGCCTNYFHFCQQAGLTDHFRQLDALLFIDQHQQRSLFKNSLLPAPFHLALSFLKMRHFNWRERWEIVRGLRQLLKSNTYPESFQHWLDTHHQSPHVQRDFWQVILVSALSESLDRIQFSAARQVFLQGFINHRDAWKVSLPTTSLDELYGSALEQQLQQQGVVLRRQSRLKEVLLEDQQVSRVLLSSGEEVTADTYLIALPWHTLSRLFPEDRVRPQFCQQATQMESAPIASVHLWFDRPLMNDTHAVLLGRLSQWIFNRSAIQRVENPERYYYQVVISQSRELANWKQEEIIGKVLSELEEIWPAAFRQATLVHSRVVREHQAVFSVTPESDQFRSDQQTEIANLYLAGDWTQTGWPATMEGAVRSGYLAAEKILRQYGIPAKILQPDLPRSPLMNWLRVSSPTETG
ncbi:MAG: hydroxysqualene dehydroxylase HpnE [Planctomycetaceae bacterium]